MKKRLCIFVIIGIILSSCNLMNRATTNNNNIIYQSKEFSVYRDSVVQDSFVAKAISRTEIVSNYISPEDQFKSPEVKFKFSINGADNSAAVGKDNVMICAGGNGNYETPAIKFGSQYTDTTKVSSND